MDRWKDFEDVIVRNKPILCEECNSPITFVGGGKYKCRECGHEMLDDFGRIKVFLDENGPSTAIAISEATGVDTDIINYFLRKGRLEIPEGSKYYLRCDGCGCSIRYGKFCPDCARRLYKDIKGVFNEDVGEKPKNQGSSEMSGKMHHINKK